MLEKKLRPAYAKIGETKQVPKYGINVFALPRVADSIETQKKILTETARDREARWWAALSTLGTGLITAVGFIGGGLLGPILKASGGVAARYAADRLGGSQPGAAALGEQNIADQRDAQPV